MKSISLIKVCFGYPASDNLLNDVSLSFGTSDLVAVIGDNGCGKTTLLNLLYGKIHPTSGRIIRNASMYMMHQKQSADSISGGEHQIVQLRNAFNSGAEILLLDEPTNNLDADARINFFNMLSSWPGGAVIVSHDRQLLQKMDKIIELSNGQITIFGGNYDFYVSQKQSMQNRLMSQYTHAEQEIKRLNKTLNTAAQTCARHEEKQRKDKLNAKRSRIAANSLKGKSAETESKKRGIIQTKLLQQNTVRQKLSDAMRDDKIKIPIPDKPFYSKEIVLVQGLNFSYGATQIFNGLNLSISGGERILLRGKNGAGKSTLLKLINGDLTPDGGTIKRFGKITYLPQDLSILATYDTPVDAIMDLSGLPRTSAHSIAANFGFRGEASKKKISILSGGELLKVTLAAILGTPAQPDLLMLDEPTNNLEIKSIKILEDALNQYRGAILLVSHDDTFVKNIEIEKTIQI